MNLQRDRPALWLALLASLTIGMWATANARSVHSPQEQRDDQLSVTGEVVEIHAPRLFTMRERGPGERTHVVLAPRTVPPASTGAIVTVHGSVRDVAGAELKRGAGWAEIGAWMRKGFAGRPLLVARSVVSGDQRSVLLPQPGVAPASLRGQPETAARSARAGTLTMRAGMLAALVHELAGREVRLLDARVVGVLEPHLFLIEPATTYMKPMGFRDRLLVLLDSGTLRVPEDVLVGSEVTVTGVVRTLLGLQVSRDAPWPEQLRPENVDRWEVRGAVVATSVQTSDGTELTQLR